LQQSDEALMEEVRDGEVGRLAVLFERHHRALFHYFHRLTGDRARSEDLVQDVFFRILRFRETYQLRSTFAAWMYQVARNAYIDGVRKTKNEADWGEDRPEPPSNEPHVDEQIWKQQEAKLLRKALEALPETQREVLILSRYQNLKYEEIGEILGCEVGAVKLRVFRAVRSLGQIYTSLAGERAS
jgi:RNA polymerase sigma factor (sigma-70 family)